MAGSRGADSAAGSLRGVHRRPGHLPASADGRSARQHAPWPAPIARPAVVTFHGTRPYMANLAEQVALELSERSRPSADHLLGMASLTMPPITDYGELRIPPWS